MNLFNWFTKRKLKNMNAERKFYSNESTDDMCPWYVLNTIINPCSCKEYTKKSSRLVLVDGACPTHGSEQFKKEVDSFNQTSYSSESPSTRST